MLVNDECNSWYNTVGKIFIYIWDRRKQLLYTDGSACKAKQMKATPLEWVVNGTECFDGSM